ALGWSADAMVNSNIAKSDLDSEMTVVRNEYEMGESQPMNVLLKRMQSVLFDWHAYGRPTIGARSDIENVPIENLRAFYRKWYQPDNAVLTVSGKFDEAKVLGWIEEKFGAIPRPERALPAEWTVEPVADGPRSFEIRRPGEAKVVMLGYRIPSALHPDINALETAVEILSQAPRGRLYKALVETGLANDVFAYPLSARCPSFAVFVAQLDKDGDENAVREAMIRTVEGALQAEPATEEEVRIQLSEAATDYARSLSDPEEFAVGLSDYIALGDWRMYFVDRDATARVTPADVNRAAAAYFVRDNRAAGVFIPDAEPRRAPAMATPDVAGIVARASFKAEGDRAEAFDVSQDNINARTERLVINGVKVALLPKKTLGGTVEVAADSLG
ncbi:MAG: insulinase family protein, partial [Duodenibacillus sp.]|nr:insulinase family protein [Duodenibacillus sp.]